MACCDLINGAESAALSYATLLVAGVGHDAVKDGGFQVQQQLKEGLSLGFWLFPASTFERSHERAHWPAKPRVAGLPAGSVGKLEKICLVTGKRTVYVYSLDPTSQSKMEEFVWPMGEATRQKYAQEGERYAARHFAKY